MRDKFQPCLMTPFWGICLLTANCWVLLCFSSKLTKNDPTSHGFLSQDLCLRAKLGSRKRFSTFTVPCEIFRPSGSRCGSARSAENVQGFKSFNCRFYTVHPIIPSFIFNSPMVNGPEEVAFIPIHHGHHGSFSMLAVASRNLATSELLKKSKFVAKALKPMSLSCLWATWWWYQQENWNLIPSHTYLLYHWIFRSYRKSAAVDSYVHPFLFH